MQWNCWFFVKFLKSDTGDIQRNPPSLWAGCQVKDQNKQSHYCPKPGTLWRIKKTQNKQTQTGQNKKTHIPRTQNLKNKAKKIKHCLSGSFHNDLRLLCCNDTGTF